MGRLKAVISNPWVNLVLGAVLGIIASEVVSSIKNGFAQTDYGSRINAELSARMLYTHQKMTMGLHFIETDIFPELDEFYANTKSLTGDPLFEGKRIDNIVFEIEKNLVRPSHKSLLEKIRYLSSDKPLGLVDDLESRQKAAYRVVEKLRQYRCCLMEISGQSKDLVCQSMQWRPDPVRHCDYRNGEVTLLR